MAPNSPAPHVPDLAEQPAQAAELNTEQPTQAAELKIMLGPATARETVPAAAAHHFITTFAILGSSAAGITGVVLTLDAATPIVGGLLILVLAELVLALAMATLVAAGRRRAGPARQASIRETPEHRDGRGKGAARPAEFT